MTEHVDSTFEGPDPSSGAPSQAAPAWDRELLRKTGVVLRYLFEKHHGQVSSELLQETLEQYDFEDPAGLVAWLQRVDPASDEAEALDGLAYFFAGGDFWTPEAWESHRRGGRAERRGAQATPSEEPEEGDADSDRELLRKAGVVLGYLFEEHDGRVASDLLLETLADYDFEDPAGVVRWLQTLDPASEEAEALEGLAYHPDESDFFTPEAWESRRKGEAPEPTSPPAASISISDAPFAAEVPAPLPRSETGDQEDHEVSTMPVSETRETSSVASARPVPQRAGDDPVQRAIQATLEQAYATGSTPVSREVSYSVEGRFSYGGFQAVDVLAVQWRSEFQVELAVADIGERLDDGLLRRADLDRRRADRVWIAVPVDADPARAATTLRQENPELFEELVDSGLGVLACCPDGGSGVVAVPIQWPRRASVEPTERDAFVGAHRSLLEQAGVIPAWGGQGYPRLT